jgi:hypothetical protein
MTRKQRQQKKGFKQLLRQMEPVIIAKLQANEKKHQFGETWRVPDWKASLHRQIPEHVRKGDPRDLVILGLMAMFHGWSTAPEKGEYTIASGDVICKVCGNPYKRHVMDLKDTFQGNPYLNVLCDGTRVKL